MIRTSSATRTTAETDITGELNLDGSGAASVDTGVGMFDHLLTAFAYHGLFDLTITTKGDLHVDDHHTVEDTMLVLGGLVDDALADRTGITRYGDASVPMDEAIARVSVDLGGRPYFVFDASFNADRIGTLSTQMISHALEAFARTARATINIQATGSNDHHVAEAIFKALARAVRSAAEIDSRRVGLPSTKGAM
jgi:imidazoleglycerol-phosphate dehydratase